MRTLNLQVVGITPILLHPVSKHQLREHIASRGGARSIEEEALEVMVKDSDGNPAVPVSWLWDAIRIGCSRITVEGKQLSFFTLKQIIRLPEDIISLRDTDNKVPEWKVYSSIQHLAPGSKRSIAVVAPMFNDWMLVIQVSVARDIYLCNQLQSNVVLEKVFVEAGKIGLGLFHPPKKQFGQFKTTFI
jgi:hypothetical protein